MLAYQLIAFHEKLQCLHIHPILSPHLLQADPHSWLTVDLHELFSKASATVADADIPHSSEVPAKSCSDCLEEYLEAWVNGRLSNYDYLMKLNDFAGMKR